MFRCALFSIIAKSETTPKVDQLPGLELMIVEADTECRTKQSILAAHLSGGSARSGKVLKVDADGTLLMKPGAEGNVLPGMDFGVYRKGEEIQDPDTGLLLGSEETKVGTITVTEDALKGRSARAKITAGTGILVGDII